VNRLGDAAYVAAVLMLYTDLPDTPLRPSPMDQSVARKLHQEAVPLSLVESALLLATLRRLGRPSELPPLPKIRSLAYSWIMHTAGRPSADRAWLMPSRIA
jgi:hypothetical protein